MLVCLALAVLGAAPGTTEPTAALPRLFVLDLKPEEGVSASNVRLLDEILLTEVQRGGEYNVVGTTDMRAMLETEQVKQLAGCDDALCLAELGGALGADLSLMGSVGALGDSYVLTLKVVAAGRAEVAARWSETTSGDPAQLAEVIRRGWASMREQLHARDVTQGRVEETPPFYTRWWFWTAIGAVAVGSATAVGLAVGLSSGPASPAQLGVSVTLPPP